MQGAYCKNLLLNAKTEVQVSSIGNVLIYSSQVLRIFIIFALFEYSTSNIYD